MSELYPVQPVGFTPAALPGILAYVTGESDRVPDIDATSFQTENIDQPLIGEPVQSSFDRDAVMIGEDDESLALMREAGLLVGLSPESATTTHDNRLGSLDTLWVWRETHDIEESLAADAKTEAETIDDDTTEVLEVDPPQQAPRSRSSGSEASKTSCGNCVGKCNCPMKITPQED